MNKTIELVNLWGAFEQQYPDGTIDDFFRHSLAQVPPQEPMPVPADQLIPDLNGQLIILIRRIGKFHMAYSNLALATTELGQIEEFGILVTIYNEGNPVKSEAIYNNIIELSSGRNMLTRMIKKGLVTEYTDEVDKRVKRLKVTPKGEKTLMEAKELVLDVAQMLLRDMPDADKQVCIQLLKPVDDRYSGLYQKQKSKPFKAIFRENMG